MTNQEMREAERKYMEECASACPHCGRDDQMRRDVSAGRTRRFKDAPPRLVVPCYCAACAGGWDEYYDLSTVALMTRRGAPR